MKRISLVAAFITISTARCAQTAPLAKTPLMPDLMGAAETTSNELWPGVPVITQLSSGAADGRILNSTGIWTYGIPGSCSYSGCSKAHGLNERLPVKSLYDANEFQCPLGKRLGGS